MTEELETLLRESLPFVVVRSTSGESMSTSEYRERLLLVRWSQETGQVAK